MEFDAEAEVGRVASFVRKVVGGARSKGAVLGLSGGIDSAVVGSLCVRALGRERVSVVLLPSGSTPKEDMDDAAGLARSWGVRATTADISGLVESCSKAAGTRGSKLAKANLQARLRMVVLYYHANSRGYLVAGTGDKSEISLGFFTKWGDGGADFLPVAHLYKTQVRALGRVLGVPGRIVAKPSSPALWPGHRATDELPADYDKLDVFLHYAFDNGLGTAQAARRAGVSKSVAERIVEMHLKTAHKRELPPSLA